MESHPSVTQDEVLNTDVQQTETRGINLLLDSF